MEDLTKQQIVLLTLLVSFVTSLATGIITVSLMDQAPQGVTQTINRVVERTIERVVSEPATQTTSAVANVLTLPEAVEKVTKGTVKIRQSGSEEVKGFGVILSANGLVLTDKSVLNVTVDGSKSVEHVAVLSTGEEFPLQLVQSEIIGDIAFLVLIAPSSVTLPTVTWASSDTSIKLGEAVYMLAEKLETGYVKRLGAGNQDAIETSIDSKVSSIGSPLFTSTGEVVGLKTASFKGTSEFYPVSGLRSIAPQLSR